MKTYKHLYEYYISDSNIRDAVHDATLGKPKHKFLREVKNDSEKYIPVIKKWAMRFWNSPHRPLLIYDGITRKKRTIVVPSDKEQIIHHMIVNTIKPLCTRSMYEHAYGSVPGRGVEKCAHFIEKAITYHPKDCKYCLKTDIRHYFQSVDRKILKAKFKRKINDVRFYNLLCAVIEYDVLGDLLKAARVQKITELWVRGKATDRWFDLQNAVATDDVPNAERIIRNLHIPEEPKSQMISAISGNRAGIPLGYYTSQWFSQFYLEDFDHYIKEQLGAKYYFRYVDDQVIFDHSKRRLHKIRKAMEQYMQTELHLEMKPNWQVFRFDYIGADGEHHGRDLDFLGYRFYSDRMVLRKTIMLKCTRKAKRINSKPKYTAYDARQMLSYLGRIAHSDTYTMYLNRVKPMVSIRQCKHKVSAFDKARKDVSCIAQGQTQNRQ